MILSAYDKPDGSPLNRHVFPEYKNFIAKICNFLLTDAKKRGILLER